MGKWAKSLFGSEKFDKVGIVLAGTTGDIYEKRFLSYLFVFLAFLTQYVGILLLPIIILTVIKVRGGIFSVALSVLII